MSFSPYNNLLNYNNVSGVLSAQGINIKKKLVLGGPVWSNDGTPITFNSAVLFNAGFKISPDVTNQDNAITVGTATHPTIQSAIDAFAGMNAGKTTITIPPGIYEEYVDLEGFSSGTNHQVRDFSDNDLLLENLTRGLQIIGDNRPYIPSKAYINGYENASSSRRGISYQVTTTFPASGPYTAHIAESFGSVSGIGPSGAQVGNPLLGGAPLSNVFLPNQIALMQRGGGVGFATKALNAQNGGGVGASAVLVYNNNPVGGILNMGGTNNLVTVPVFGLSFADGVALNTLITNNPGIQITISPLDPVYDPPLGTNYAYSQILINGPRDQLTINMVGPLPDYDDNIVAVPSVLVNPDFGHARVGVVAGDRVAVSDSSLAGNLGKSLHTITAVSGNVITVSPPVPAVGSGGVDFSVAGSSVTFLPNVCISPPVIANRPYTAAFQSSNVSFSMNGVWVDQNASQPFASILEGFKFVGGSVLANNLAVTDFFGTTANALAVHVAGGSAYITDGYRGGSGQWAVVGWSGGVGISTNASLRCGSVFVTNITQGVGLGASIGSQVGIENLQVMGNAGLFQPDSGVGVQLGGGGNYADVTVNVNKLFHVADVWGPGIALSRGSTCIASNPSVRVERCYNPANGTNSTGAGINVSCGSKMSISRGVFYSAGGLASQPRLTSYVRDCANVNPPDTLPNVGVYVEEGGSFQVDGNILYLGNDFDVQTVQNAEYSAPFDTFSPGDVFTLNGPGAVSALNHYPKQQIGGAGITNVQIDPTEVFGLDNLWVGKSFMFVSGTAFTHMITLLGGATFLSGGNTYTFPPVAGSCVSIRVLSASSVTILDNLTSTALVSGSGANAVNVSLAANPAVGEVLTATSATTATWQALPGVSPLGYVTFYGLAPGDYAATIAVGAPLDFPTLGINGGTSAIYRSGVGTFVLPDIGTYDVSWTTSVDEPGQLQVTLNTVVIPYTTAGRATGTSQISNRVLVATVTPSTVLSVINPAGNATALTITPVAGGTHAAATVLTIVRVA